MITQVRNQFGRIVDEPYKGRVIDALHNDIDEIVLDGYIITIESVFSTPELRTIQIGFTDEFKA